MITEVIDRQLARLRTRLAKTGLPRFFAWWGRELLACLPARWRALLAGHAQTLLLESRGRELVVWRERSGECVEFGRIDLDLPADAQAAEFERLRVRTEEPAVRVLYCIAADRVLRRLLTLPAAAEDNLRQVLGFEMDRQTPFKADQVYFDSRIVARDAAARTLRVELVVLPRAQLDAELAGLAGGALAIDGVDTWTTVPGGERSGINLLPAERRAQRRNLRLPLNLGLAALAIVLLGVNLSERLANRVVAFEAMQAEIGQAETAAQQATDLKKSLQDSIDGANFLANKKRQGLLIIALLDDLTKRLDDDTFLERLSVENNQVQLQGQSKEAARLIGVLAGSPYLSNPTLQGQIQPDPRSGKERFQISAEIKPPGAATAAPASDGKEAAHGT